MKPKIFIDGQEGTTGLRLRQRLGGRDDIELTLLPDELRKDIAARRDMLNRADIAFLCLPDAAAVEAVSMVESESVRIIDTSTAHRTAEGWVYGFKELSFVHEAAIKSARRLANPGCHATGFISCVYPLVSMGILPADYPASCFSLTGYSGGGKKMIADYETGEKRSELYAPRQYGLNQSHKHLPEMRRLTGLAREPVFIPVVDDFYSGMEVTVPLDNSALKGCWTAESIHEAMSDFYSGQRLVRVAPFSNDGLLEANRLTGRDTLEIHVCGNGERTVIVSLFDNLGKGASGAAVQNMNLMLGFEETKGLAL